MEPENIFCTYCEEHGHTLDYHNDDGPLCVCGHFKADHHRSWFAITKYTPNGGELVEECEFYGTGSVGGAMRNEDGKWVDHCMYYKEAK